MTTGQLNRESILRQCLESCIPIDGCKTHKCFDRDHLRKNRLSIESKRERLDRGALLTFILQEVLISVNRFLTPDGLMQPFGKLRVSCTCVEDDDRRAEIEVPTKVLFH